jgi:hypothetical protein
VGDYLRYSDTAGRFEEFGTTMADKPDSDSAEANTTVHPRLAGTKIADLEKSLDLSVLKDRVALVTGGVAGIGLGIVRALVQAGAWVAICDLNEDAGKRAEAELIGDGYKYVLLISCCSLSGGACLTQWVDARIRTESSSSTPTPPPGNPSWQLSRQPWRGRPRA